MSPNSALDEALRAHLVRLLVAGGLSIVLGGALARLRPALGAFGLMNAAWGAVDVLIALLGLRNTHVDNGHELSMFVALNLGLNGGYTAVGITMVALAGERKAVKGSGAAVVIQGLILLALDGYFANTAPFWLAPGFGR